MAGERLYMQIQIPDAFPLTLPFCSGRIRKNCGVCIFFYLFLYVLCALWFSLISYFIICPVLFFFFVATFVAAFFSFICLFCLELSPKSFSSFLFSQTWINTLKHHFPFPLPFLFYFHIFSPFCPNIIIFPSAFAAVLLFHELSCPFFGILYFSSGETQQGFGPFFP